MRRMGHTTGRPSYARGRRPAVRGLFAAAALLVLLGAGGCINPMRGDTLYRVRVDTLEQEKLIRRELWRVGRAVEDVRVRYALEDVTIQIEITDLGGLGQTTPALSGLANVSGAKVYLNSRLFLEEDQFKHDLDDVLVGLIAHELMHALHYARMSEADLIELGQRYRKMVGDPNGPQREWVRAYERLTDMMTIQMGYGEQLIHQKRASMRNLAANDPPAVWDFYLDEEEIRAMMADQQLLESEIGKAIDILNLRSAEAARRRPEFDDDGDLVRNGRPARPGSAR